jgi:outer membrane protein
MNSLLKCMIGFGLSLLLQIVFNGVQAQNVVELTLEETLRYALENNVEAKNAQLETLIARATVIERRSQGLPQISANLDFTHNAAIPIQFVPNEGAFFQPDVDSDVLPLRFGVNYSSILAARINQMIFDGSYFVGLKAARTFKMLTEFDRIKTEIDVKESVKKAYFTVLVNEQRQALVQANLSRLDTLLKETEALFEAGFAEKIDVSRIKVQRNNTKSELDRINTAYQVSAQLLKLQMGMPMEVELRLKESLSELSLSADVAELMNADGQRRVEIDQVQTNFELVELDLKNNQVQYIPRLNAFATYQRNAAAQNAVNIWESERWFTGAFVGLSLSIPVFDGLAKSARIQQNRVQLRQLENQNFFLEQNIEVEKFQAKINLRNSLNSLKVQEENKDLALEVFRMAKIKFEEGVGSNLEVVEADSTLKEAESNYFSALYDALVAKVDLEKALGIL